MNKASKAEKYEKMDKLGEGTYGVVYKAQGTSFYIQISKQVKSLLLRKSVYNQSKRVFLPQPFVKFLF